MTLTQLRYIIAIADTGSMNEAAKSLFISQPSLSLAVKELEKEIGTRLFKRSNRGVSVTQEGMEFLSYARQVVEQYQLMESRYIEKKNIKKKFGVSMQHYTFAVNAFVEMVKQFGMDEYEFAVRETKTYEVIKDVKDFHSEIGILYLNEFNKKVLSKMLQSQGLNSIHYWNVEFTFICGKGILWQIKKRLRSKSWKNIHACHLNRGNITPFILQKKC